MKYGPIAIYKKIGQTPLMALEALRFEHPEWAGLPMTYAGRLDPVAEGVLLVLVGEDCKEKDKYIGLAKEYELSVLFGFDTDTYDLLGEVKSVYNATPEVLSERSSDLIPSTLGQTISESTSGFATIIKKFIGDIHQSYPPYSSRTVGGKPLFQIARDGKIDEIKIPEHVVHIENIEILENKNISKEDLGKHINSLINTVKGDFRQDDIKKRWVEALESSSMLEYPIVKLKVSCGSGSYMRVLAHDLGRELGIPALAYHIKRTKVGEYEIKKDHSK
jgi:tRNA pseudouridine55 synthase